MESLTYPCSLLDRIPLRTRGGGVVGYAKVSPDDYHDLHQFRWFKLHGSGYAMRSWKNKSSRGAELMHRRIMGLRQGDGLTVDHMNHDKLDNRRENLRVVTAQENNQNLQSKPGSSSRFRGVSKASGRNRWRAMCQVDGKSYCLGSFVSEEEAAEAARQGRLKYMAGALG